VIFPIVNDYHSEAAMFSCLPGEFRVSIRNDFVLKSFVNAIASSMLRGRGRIIPEPWHKVRREVLRPLLSPEGVQKDHRRGRQTFSTTYEFLDLLKLFTNVTS